MPKLREVIGGATIKIYFEGTVCRRWVLAALQTVKLGLNKVGNQAKSLKYSGKSCISYQFIAYVQIHGHRPRYTANNEAAENDVCVLKCQVAAASAIREMRSSSESTFNPHQQRRLDWTEWGKRGQWLGLPSHRTSRQWTSSCGATLEP